jgi:hypothetical protein
LTRILAFSAAIAFAGCTNDYGEFNIGGGVAGSAVVAGSAGVQFPFDAGIDRSAPGVGGGGGTGGDIEDAGEDLADTRPDVSDARAEADVSVDAPPDAPVDAPSDRPTDAPSDVVDATPDVVIDVRTDTAEVGSDAAADADAPASIDAPSEADVSASVDAADADEAEAAPSCGPGTKLCGPGCVNVNDPLTGCASASCAPCSLPHAAATCGITGECAVLGCAAGYEDCDTIAANGCESLLSSDVGNCGACGRACAGSDVQSKQCAGGVCISTCNVGHANCSYPFSGTDDGCEIASDNTHCGSCGNDCTKQGSGFACGAAGASQCGCVVDIDCRVMGMGTCDVATGRCTCDVACQPGEACRHIIGPTPDVCSCNGGNACTAGQTCCQWPAGCRNLQNDPSSCGACGRSCPSGFFCSAGQCACSTDLECNAGAPGTCAAGQCICTGITCPKGQRCQSDGSCG